LDSRLLEYTVKGCDEGSQEEVSKLQKARTELLKGLSVGTFLLLFLTHLLMFNCQVRFSKIPRRTRPLVFRR